MNMAEQRVDRALQQYEESLAAFNRDPAEVVRLGGRAIAMLITLHREGALQPNVAESAVTATGLITSSYLQVLGTSLAAPETLPSAAEEPDR